MTWSQAHWAKHMDFAIFCDCCGHKRNQSSYRRCGHTRGKWATLYLWCLWLDMGHPCGKLKKEDFVTFGGCLVKLFTTWYLCVLCDISKGFQISLFNYKTTMDHRKRFVRLSSRNENLLEMGKKTIFQCFIVFWWIFFFNFSDVKLWTTKTYCRTKYCSALGYFCF